MAAHPLGGTSVVVCTMNRADDLMVAIDSFERQTVPFDELVIVDAGDEGVLQGRLAARMANSRLPYQYLHSEPSTTRQRNRGADLAHHELLFFFDDDVVLEPEYHQEVLAVYRDYASPQLAGVTGRLLNPPGGNRFTGLLKAIFMHHRWIDRGRSRMQLSGEMVLVKNPQQVARVAAMAGFNQSYKRSVFLQHRFDESLGGYAIREDMDLCTRIGRTHHYLQTPHAGIYHNRSPANRTKLRALNERRMINYTYMFRKNFRDERWRWPFFVWSIVGYFALASLEVVRYGTVDGLLGLVDGMRRVRRGDLPPLPSPSRGAA
jgi:glycosyltransferase involved in cell wall biosynthesis